MKKLLFTFFAVMCCTTMVSAENYRATKINNIWYILDDANLTATITWGGKEPMDGTPEYSGSITIPSTVTYENKDYKVTSIGWHAFSYCPNLTSITIPNSVTSIGESSFYECKSLTSITIPNSVTSIGEYAFYGCISLTSITIPNSVTSIETRTFDGCSKLASVTIPNSVTSIKDYAFGQCDSLTSFIIPSSLKSIGENVFYNCTNLAFVLWDGDVPQEFPLENTDIFEGCNGLQKLVVCDKYADAYKSCFSNYSDKVENLTTFRDNALTEIPDAQEAAPHELTKQDTALLQGYISAIASATLPSVAFTNKKCALGIINLRPMKNEVINEIKWNVYEADKIWGILTDEDKSTINGYIDVINVATDEETIAKTRQSALNVVYLREARINTIAELNALDATYRGIDFSFYKDAVTNATSVDEVNSIKDALMSIINNGNFATIGSIKYLLNDDGGEYIYAGSITITDKDLYQSDYDFTANNLTYSRTFTNTSWQALYVPFAMDYYAWSSNFDVAAINNFHEYTDEDGKTVKTELEVRLVKDHTLKPNYPYLIKAHDADEINPQEINLSTRKFCKSDEKSIDCSSVERKYTFTGTYKKMTGLSTNKFIFMSGGKLCMATNDEVVLSPQRWYLKIESRGSQYGDGSNASAQAKEFDIKLLDDGATGIDEITITRTPLQNNNKALYNLNGIRANNSNENILIRDRKKFYQK